MPTLEEFEGSEEGRTGKARQRLKEHLMDAYGYKVLEIDRQGILKVSSIDRMNGKVTIWIRKEKIKSDYWFEELKDE